MDNEILTLLTVGSILGAVSGAIGALYRDEKGTRVLLYALVGSLLAFWAIAFAIDAYDFTQYRLLMIGSIVAFFAPLGLNYLGKYFKNRMNGSN